MADPDAPTIPALDQLADDAEVYIDHVIAGIVPNDPITTQDAWDTIRTREVLRGTLLPIVVTWVHPQAGWVCIDLAGGPTEHALVFQVTPMPARFHEYIRWLRFMKRPVYLGSDFFERAPGEQIAEFMSAARDQQADDQAAQQARIG